MPRNDLEASVITLGTIAIKNDTDGVSGVPFDRIALEPSNNLRLLLLSIVADGMRVKAVRALLHTNTRQTSIDINCDEKFTRTGFDHGASVNGYGIQIASEGYETTILRMPFGECHAIFRAREPDFMAVLDDEALWNLFREDRHTTPILREWVPWIREELARRQLLIHCWCHRATSAILSATVDQLDDVVSKGVREGHIRIPVPGFIDAESRVIPTTRKLTQEANT